MDKKYLNIVRHYESCLEKYGDTHRGVDWPRTEDVDTRYRVMLEVIKEKSPRKIELLDFGCGTSGLYAYIKNKNMNNIVYSGLDISQKFIDISKAKFPRNKYYCLDVLTEDEKLTVFDYVVMNGVFTEKRDLSFDEMLSFFKNVIKHIFPKVKTAMAFNLMSKQVDWKKKESFHVPLDLLTEFLVKDISRNFIVRHDYGLYEYTTYVYR